MDSRDLLFGQSDTLAALPITVRLSGSSPLSAAPARPPQPQPHSAEDFHLVDQTGQLIERLPLGGPSAQMVSVPETGQVVYSQTRELFEELFYVVLVVATADSNFISSDKVKPFSGSVHAAVVLAQVGKSCLQPLLILLNKLVIIKPGCYCMMRSNTSTTAAFSVFPG